jgi:23S rRNA pseudouridine1911/1915/1917 synthase
VAKTAVAHTNLAKQLKARTMSRRYYALVEGHVPLDEGTVSAAIGRHVKHRKEMTVRHLGGRAAVTQYRVMRRYHQAQGSRLKAQGNSISLEPRASSLEPRPLRYTLLDVSLGTGRTHQIRVHMAHLGYPVVGDTTYGRRPSSFWHALSVTRQLLHAYQLSFCHPSRGISMTLSAPIPDDMKPWVAGLISGE